MARAEGKEGVETAGCVGRIQIVDVGIIGKQKSSMCGS